jgi:CDP-diglyceride synthetase
MNANKKRSFLSGIPSGGLALLAVVASFIVVFGIGELGEGMKIKNDVVEAIPYIIYGLFIAVCCFFIVRQNPKSIWYVPLICNAVGIIAAIIEPTFWVTSLWMLICGGWVLSIIASIIGNRFGKRSS